MCIRDRFIDSIIKDGLWDAYNDKHMGTCAEMCVSENNYSRQDLDEFAKISYERALVAQEKDLFSDEITPVTVPYGKSDSKVINKDEEPSRVNFEKIPLLKPVFEKNGTITPANASKINDGASALMLMTEDKANSLGLKPLVTINAQASAAHEPEWFTTAPSNAVENALKKGKISKNDVDYFELNEAFSVVGLANIKLLDIDSQKVNVNGGAIALGHPVGCTGSRLITTLLHELERQDKELGFVTMCQGGSLGIAIVLERI